MASHPEEATDPVPESYLATVEYNNRVYQQYAITHDTYHAPVDEDEEERLQIMHNVLGRVFEGRFVFPPLNRLRRVLDCGYGSASWACEIAEQYPNTEVLGVDIYPSMQPDEVPANVYLQVDDLNRELTFPAHNFDLVNSQMMASGIHANRWLHYVRDLLRVTRPGGWTQMVELYFNVQSDNGSLTQDHALSQWSTLYLESLQSLKDLRVPLRLHTLMREAGFVDVEYRMIQLHTCGWSTDQRDNEIGTANRDNVQRFLASLAMHPMTEKLGMSIQDVQLLVARARLEADDPSFKAYFPLYVCIGRKSRSRRR